MKGFKAFFLFLFLATTLSAQPELSLITVYPGDAIYSAFGHTAFRYLDKECDFDILYNFGTFDFRDPKFVPKFVQGKLDYFLGVVHFKREFKNYSLLENRSVVEQKLNLTPEEKPRTCGPGSCSRERRLAGDAYQVSYLISRAPSETTTS